MIEGNGAGEAKVMGKSVSGCERWGGAMILKERHGCSDKR